MSWSKLVNKTLKTINSAEIDFMQHQNPLYAYIIYMPLYFVAIYSFSTLKFANWNLPKLNQSQFPAKA